MGYKGGKANKVREQDKYVDQNSGISKLLEASEDNTFSPANIRLAETIYYNKLQKYYIQWMF